MDICHGIIIFCDTCRAVFTHRHSRHVPMLACPGGPKHNEEILFFVILWAIYNSKRTKTPEDIEQINITNNRVKNAKLFPCLPPFFLYGNHAFFLSPFLSHRRTHSTDMHSRTHAEMHRNLSSLPREFINKIVWQL